MTSTARLAAALALSIIALLFGLVSAGSTGTNDVAMSSRTWSPRLSVEPELIDSDVARVVTAGLFPRANLRDDAPTTVANSSAGLAQALYTPNLSAFVRRTGAWRLHVYDDSSDTLIFEEGDQLSDGWLIASIAPTHVLIRRDGETRRFDAFDRGEVTDEN